MVPNRLRAAATTADMGFQFANARRGRRAQAGRDQDRDGPGRVGRGRDRRDESPAGSEAFWSGYDLLWDEERAGAADRRSPLDRARIVDAALRVADAEGLDAVTMRRVARELRTGAMSLYRHVPGKEGLVSFMIDRALWESAPPGEPSGDWRNDLRMLATAMWDFILRHPWYPQAVAERPPVTPRGLAAFDFALSILDHTGLPMSDRGAIVVSLTNTVLAAAQNAAADRLFEFICFPLTFNRNVCCSAELWLRLRRAEHR